MHDTTTSPPPPFPFPPHAPPTPPNPLSTPSPPYPPSPGTTSRFVVFVSFRFFFFPVIPLLFFSFRIHPVPLWPFLPLMSYLLLRHINGRQKWSAGRNRWLIWCFCCFSFVAWLIAQLVGFVFDLLIAWRVCVVGWLVACLIGWFGGLRWSVGWLSD